MVESVGEDRLDGYGGLRHQSDALDRHRTGRNPGGRGVTRPPLRHHLPRERPQLRIRPDRVAPTAAFRNRARSAQAGLPGAGTACRPAPRRRGRSGKICVPARLRHGLRVFINAGRIVHVKTPGRHACRSYGRHFGRRGSARPVVQLSSIQRCRPAVADAASGPRHAGNRTWIIAVRSLRLQRVASAGTAAATGGRLSESQRAQSHRRAA